MISSNVICLTVCQMIATVASPFLAQGSLPVLDPQVLSVVATQVKSILDAVKNGKKNFRFMGEEIRLIPSVGVFVRGLNCARE